MVTFWTSWDRLRAMATDFAAVLLTTKVGYNISKGPMSSSLSQIGYESIKQRLWFSAFIRPIPNSLKYKLTGRPAVLFNLDIGDDMFRFKVHISQIECPKLGGVRRKFILQFLWFSASKVTKVLNYSLVDISCSSCWLQCVQFIWH